jgi:hypothetical protein
MTFKQLQDRVMHLGGYGEVDRNRIKVFLNTVYRDIVSRGRRWRWLETSTNLVTVANTQTVNMPAGVKYPGRLRPGETGLTEPQFIEWHSWVDDFNRRATADRPKGMPKKYSIYEDKFWFDPIPDKVYTYSFNYWRNVTTELSGDNDIPILPTEHHDVLMYGALMLAAARDKDPQMMGYWQDMYEGAQRMLRAHSEFKQAESPVRIPMPDHYHGTFPN